MKNRSINIIEAAMKYRQIAIIITTMLVLFGVFALWKMPRNEFPQFTIRQGLVIGVFQGATSAQVEEQLTTKIENFLFGFQEVNRAKTYSISKEGMVIIFVEVNDNVKDPDAFWDKVKFGLNELKAQLPQQVLALIANNDFGDTSALLLNIESGNSSNKEQKEYIKSIENELRKIKGVSKVKHFGLQQEQIGIYLNREKLATYGVRSATVFSALQLEGGVYYGGELDNNQLITPIHVPTSFKSENEVAQQIIYTDPTGNIVRLKDVATIKREIAEPESFIKNNGNRSLLISLEMQPGQNIVEFGKEVDKTLKEVMKTLPSSVKVSKVADMPTAVNTAIQDFLHEFGIAVLAVIVVTMLLLPFRIAAVAGSTIPISILITIGILYLIGVELHTVSLAGLIVVLGMVVDNAIVVIDSHVELVDHKVNPWTAAWKSASELFIPVFSATLAITVSYLPFIFFMTGMPGDFVRTLPVTIGIALGTSLLVSCFLVPYMCFVFIKKGVHREDKKGKSILDYLQSAFDAGLDIAFRYPKTTISIGILSIVFGIFISTKLPSQLFPKVERNQFAIEIYLPEGMPLQKTAFVVDSLEKMIRKDQRIVTVASFVGSSSPRFHTVYAPNMPSKNYAQMIINTKTKENAIELLNEFEKKYRNYFPEAYIRIKQLDMMASSAPIEIRISGNSIDSIKRVAQQVKAIFNENKNIIWVRNDYQNPRQGVSVNVNDEVANRLGFSRGTISSSLALGFKGISMGTIWEGDYPVDVKVKNEDEKRNGFDDIENQNVTSLLSASTVPVRQLATISNDWTEGQIVRRNGVRTLTVRADIKRNTLAYKVLAEVQPKINAIKSNSTTITYGGEAEAEVENYVPLTKALLTTVILIFFILLFQFKRLKIALLIMVTMPLSLFGSALGLWITTFPFGLTAFLGIIGLMGIVVRNGIILIDYAEILRNTTTMTVQEIAIAAGKRRMRPIFLTSAAASIGVIPMIASGSSLWGPLGSVTCFGLIFSMILTLFVLPVLYYLLTKNQPSTPIA